jgi:hypothetical protein
MFVAHLFDHCFPPDETWWGQRKWGDNQTTNSFAQPRPVDPNQQPGPQRGHWWRKWSRQKCARVVAESISRLMGGKKNLHFWCSIHFIPMNSTFFPWFSQVFLLWSPGGFLKWPTSGWILCRSPWLAHRPCGSWNFRVGSEWGILIVYLWMFPKIGVPLNQNL